MNQTENKININDVIGQLGETASNLSKFLTQIKDGLPEEHKKEFDSEISKAQSGLAKIVGDVEKFKI